MDSSEVKKMLRIDGHMDALSLIERLENGISRKAEYQYLKAFMRESSFDDEASRLQLRCLWTAYCFHIGADVDTALYDSKLRLIWAQVTEAGQARGYRDFDDFDDFMCGLLV